MIWQETSAHADDLADEADLQFKLAAERYEAGDFKGALEHFLASNRLVPNKNVVFNIARTYEQLKQAPDAYRYYLSALDGEQNPAVKKRIEDALARVAPSVAVLKVETTPPGATVYLDRVDLGARGQAPRTLGLPAGKHRVIVELAGYERAQSDEVDLKLGAETKVSLKLVPILGTVRVDGEPRGASVRLDKEDSDPICVVPCVANVPPGKHQVYVTSPDYATFEGAVDVPPKGEAQLRAKLTRETGAVVVNSDIRDALITIDDRAGGFTPAVLNVPVGRHKLKVSLPGFRPVERDIDVATSKQTTVDVALSTLEEVTAASRVAESVEDAPASVTIISGQELRGMGYPTIAEAMRGVRGMYLSDDRSYVTVGVRGFGRPGDYGNRILVMIDGHPTNDNYIWSSYVGFDGRVDLDDIERIEIIRGPGSVLYGTSAFFGVINLVTRDRTAPTHGEVAVGTAEYGVGKARATGVVKFSEEAGIWSSVAIARGQGRDFYFPEYASNPTDPNAELGANNLPTDGHARGVDGFDAATIGGRAWYKSLTAQWFLNTRKKKLPTGEYGAIFGDPRNHFSDTRGFFEARFDPQVSKTVQLLSRAHGNFYNFDGFTAYRPVDDGPTRDTYRGIWGGIEQRAILTPSEAVRVTVGGEVIQHFQAKQRGENDAGPLVLANDGSPTRNDPFTVGAVYALGDVAASKRFKISTGARVDYYSSLQNFDFLPAFNPRLAFIVKPYDGGNIKIMGGKAFRAPSVYELYYTSTAQLRPDDLKPEQVYAGEVEFSHRFSPTWTATAAAFTNYVKDLVELRDVGAAGSGLVQYANSNAPVLVYGSEYEVRRDFRDGWMAALTYTVQRAQYTEDPGLRHVPNSPSHLGSAKGAVPILGRTLRGMTRLSIEGPRHDGSFRAGDPTQRTTDPGVIWDLVLSGEVERMGVRYNLGVYNVADWKYDTVPSGEFRQRTIVQSGRTFLAQVAATF